VVHGDDLDEQATDLMYRVPRQLGILRTIPYTEGVSSSDIRRRLQRGRPS